MPFSISFLYLRTNYSSKLSIVSNSKDTFFVFGHVNIPISSRLILSAPDREVVFSRYSRTDKKCGRVCTVLYDYGRSSRMVIITQFQCTVWQQWQCPSFCSRPCFVSGIHYSTVQMRYSQFAWTGWTLASKSEAWKRGLVDQWSAARVATLTRKGRMHMYLLCDVYYVSPKCSQHSQDGTSSYILHESVCCILRYHSKNRRDHSNRCSMYR
jgi:hypothetical protein